MRAQRLTTPPPVPDGGELVGEDEVAPDRRSGASRALVGAKLKALHGRRDDLEAAIDDLLDPLVAPSMPAFDIAVLLLFLSEVIDGLPVPVACKEASQLSVAYGGTGEDDGQKPPRNGKLVAKVPHLYGVIGAFARERLGIDDGGPRPRPQ